MSVALVPPPGIEMDDSIMQDDHPGDVAITVDMESPKHHGLAPQAMVFVDSSAPQGFWIPTPTVEATNQFEDVEFETQGATYDEDGMMSAAEVEMTAAPTYAEEYEYEMSYETGQPEVNYEIEDIVVHDAEVLDAAHDHEPHVDSAFATFAHEQLGQIEQVLGAASVEAEGPVEEVAVVEITAVAPAPVEAVETYPTLHEVYHEENAADEEAQETTLLEPGDEVALVTVVATTAVDRPESAHGPLEGTLEEIYGQDLAAETSVVSTVVDIKPQQETIAALESVAAADATEPTEEPTADTYTTTTYEEAEQENRFITKVPPIILTSFSETSTTPRVLALFEAPDSASVPSSSKQTDEAPILLLDQHHYLFLEPITAFLTHLRTELLQSQPEIIPPAEFEYKELQLVVRDLDLILTEDNIYSKEITLFDLESMHKSCGLTGYLHLNISLQPRFIDRYRAIRHVIDTQGRQNVSAQPEGVPTDKAAALAEYEHPEDEESKGAHGDSKQAEDKATNDGDLAAGDDVQEPEVEAEEPPLPPDDDADASSWSEEQDELQEGEVLATGEEGDNEWEEVYDPDANEGDVLAAEAVGEAEELEAQNEESIHEDEYVPGDEPEVTAEHEQLEGADVYYEEGQPAELEYTAEEQADEAGKPSHQTDSHGEVYNDEATVDEGKPFDELTELVHEEQAADERAEEDAGEGDGGVYLEENEDWDEYEEGALEGVDDPEATAEEQVDTDATAPASVEDAEDVPTTGVDVIATADHREPHKGVSPVRKRSFNEVEGEPEDDLPPSSTSKKPRHI